MESIMKKIINNEQMISISDLKKQAKIARKQNNNLSNHSQSLKAIAQSYNYDSWENLLDSAYLIVEKKQMLPEKGSREQIDWQNDRLLNDLFVVIRELNTIHAKYEFLNQKAGYNSIFNFFQEELLNKYEKHSQQYQKLKLLIELMVSLYTTHKSKFSHISFKDILSYADFRKSNPLYQTPLPEDVSNKLKKYMILNNVTVLGLSLENPLQIVDINYVEDSKQHNEIILDLESMREKIEIMAEVYTKIEQSKSNNMILIDWLSDYESFIRLSLHSQWTAESIHEYHSNMRRRFNKTFNLEKHKEILNCLKYYFDGKYEEVHVIVNQDSTIHQKIEELKKEGSIYEYDLKKTVYDDERSSKKYYFYYLVH